MQPFSCVQFRFNRLMTYLMDEMEITWCSDFGHYLHTKLI